MARSRKVEPEAAIQAAMALFWKHGYCDLGTRQIEDETGITRFTLQTTYGGKMPLFLKTLDTYLDMFQAFLQLQQQQRPAGVDTIASWFQWRADPAGAPDIGCLGCLMLNSVVEFSNLNPEINQRAARYFDMLRNHFRANLHAAKAAGILRPEFDVDARAEILIGAILGLNIIIRAAGDNAAGQMMANAIADMVRQWADERPAKPQSH